MPLWPHLVRGETDLRFKLDEFNIIMNSINNNIIQYIIPQVRFEESRVECTYTMVVLIDPLLNKPVVRNFNDFFTYKY